MWWAFGILMASLLVIALLLMRRRIATAPARLTSIVLLRKSPRVLGEADVRGMLRRAGTPSFELMPLPPVAPEISGFAVMNGRTPMFYVVSAARPYCDDPGAESLKFEDPRGRAAFAEHGAWVSIDTVGGPPPAGVRDKVFALMSRIAAELMDHESTLLYCTWLDRVALPGEAAESTLRGPSPLSLFAGDDDLNVPIVNTAAGDAAIQRATAEAQRNLPTLLAAWERAGAGSEAMVKGRFSHEGRDEFMWIKVSDVNGSTFSGELGNQPAFVPNLQKGQRISITADSVVDWACLIDGKPMGLYVERVLHDRSRR